MVRLVRVPFKPPGHNRLHGTGDIGTDVSDPSRCPSMHRTSRLLPACIPNRLDSSGRLTARAARWQVYKRVRRQSGWPASCKYPADLPAQFVKRALEHGTSRIKDDCPVFGQQVHFRPNRLTHTAAQAVANDCLSEGTGDSKPEAGRNSWFGKRQTKSCEVSTRHSSTGIIDLSKLRRADDPPCPRERQLKLTQLRCSSLGFANR
jgi:hypothetical protein